MAWTILGRYLQHPILRLLGSVLEAGSITKETGLHTTCKNNWINGPSLRTLPHIDVTVNVVCLKDNNSTTGSAWVRTEAATLTVAALAYTSQANTVAH